MAIVDSQVRFLVWNFFGKSQGENQGVGYERKNRQEVLFRGFFTNGREDVEIINLQAGQFN
jgi:hypothetical protein